MKRLMKLIRVAVVAVAAFLAPAVCMAQTNATELMDSLSTSLTGYVTHALGLVGALILAVIGLKVLYIVGGWLLRAIRGR